MKKFISVALATLLIATNGTTTAYTAWAHTAMANSSTYLGSATIFATGFTVAGYVAYKQNGPSDLALYLLPIGAIASLAAAKAFSCIPCYNPGATLPSLV